MSDYLSNWSANMVSCATEVKNRLQDKLVRLIWTMIASMELGMDPISLTVGQNCEAQPISDHRD